MTLQKKIIAFAFLMVLVGCDPSFDGNVDGDGDDTDTEDTDTGAECEDERWVFGDYSYGSSLTDLWVGSEDGSVLAYNSARMLSLHETPGGWSFSSYWGVSDSVTDVSGPSLQDLYVSYANGTVQHRNASAISDIRNLRNYEDIWIGEDGKGFVIEEDSLFRFDGNGLVEVEDSLPKFTSIFGVAPDQVYAGANQAIYVFNGELWALLFDSSEFEDSNNEENPVWVTEDGTVFFGQGEYVFISDGATWTHRVFLSEDVTSVSGTSISDYFVTTRTYESWTDPSGEGKYGDEPTDFEFGHIWHVHNGQATLIWETCIGEANTSDPLPGNKFKVWSSIAGQVYFWGGALYSGGLYFYDGIDTTLIQHVGCPTDVAIHEDGEIWVVSADGKVQHGQDLYYSWDNEVIGPEHESFTAISLVEGASPMVVGNFGTLARKKGEAWATLEEADPCGSLSKTFFADGKGWGICSNGALLVRLDADEEMEYVPLPEVEDGEVRPSRLAVADDGSPIVVGYIKRESTDESDGMVARLTGTEWSITLLDSEMDETLFPLDIHLGEGEAGMITGLVEMGEESFGFTYDLQTEETVFLPETGEHGLSSTWALDLEHVVSTDRRRQVWFYDGAHWTHELVCGASSILEVEGDSEGTVFLLTQTGTGSSHHNEILVGNPPWE